MIPAPYDFFGLHEHFSSPKGDIPRSTREAVLKNIAKIFNDNNIEYMIFYGSLLGIIRDKKLLEHDDDVDFLVSDSDFNRAVRLLTPLYVINGPDHFKSGESSDGKPELYKYIKKNGKIIDILTNDAKLPGVFEIDHIYPIKSIFVASLGIRVNIPNKPEKILETVYSNWKIPTRDKGYNL